MVRRVDAHMKKLLVAMLVALMVLMGLTGIASADIVGDFTVSGGINGVDYVFADGILTVKTGVELTIYDNSTSTQGIVLDPGAGNETNIILNNVSITSTGDHPCIDVKSGTANITSVGFNYLTFSGTGNHAALHVPYGTKAVINGNTSISCTVTTGMGAAIGGSGSSSSGYPERNGEIVINGPVYAYTRDIAYSGAAIGTGASSAGNYTSVGGTITINSRVTAIAGDRSAAIGGGYGCAGGNVIINEGAYVGTYVEVTGGAYAYSIGSGASKTSSTLSGGTLTINGNSVELASSSNAAIIINDGELYTYSGVSKPVLGGLTVNGGSVSLQEVDYSIFNSSNKLTFRNGDVTLYGATSANVTLHLQPALNKQILLQYNSNTYTYTNSVSTTITTKNLTLSSSSTSTHSHAACGGTASSCTHADAHSNITYTALTDATQLSDGGNYYLTGNLSISRYITIDETVNLCLNGYTITYTNYDDGISIAGGTLNLCDCAGNGGITESYSRTRSHGLIRVQSNGTFNMYSGMLHGSQAYNGSGVYLSSTTAVFNMYGGRIDSCYGPYSTSYSDSDSHGGAVYCVGGSTTSSGGSTFRMYGGTINNCRADVGGAIYAERDCTIIIENAAFESCRADEAGSALYFYAHTSKGGSASFSIKNTTFTDCTGYDPSKAILQYETPVLELKTDELKSAFTFTRLTMSNCTFTNCGGVPLDLDGIKAKIENCTFNKNVSSEDSLAIDLYNSDVTLTNTKIINNKADSDSSFHPPAMYVSNSIMKMDGCTVSNNKSDHNASGIYVSSSDVTLKDTNVTSNRSTEYFIDAAGVYVTSSTSELKLEGKVNVSGNVNTLNEATNVYLDTNKLITLTDGALDSGSSVGVTVTGKTNSNVVRFLKRSGGNVVSADLAAFNSDQGYPTGIDGDNYGVMGDPVTLTVQANNANYGIVSGAGTYNKGAQVLLSATPAEGYAFVNWTDDEGNEVSTEAEYTFTATETCTLTANFVKLITITANVNATEGGTVTGGGSYAQGSMVTLTATPNEGCLFINWTDADGNEVSTYPSFSAVYHASETLTANFSYNISLLIVPHAAVDAGCMALGVSLTPIGESVTIYPHEAGGYVFVNWTDENGDVFSTEKRHTFTPTRPMKLNANFGLAVTVTAQSGDATMGSASGTATVVSGTEVTLTATPAEGYSFVNWTDDEGSEVSTEAEYTFTATETCTLTANFVKLVTITVTTDDASMGTGAIIVEGADPSVPSTSVTVPVGATATLTATRATGYQFVEWQENGVKVEGAGAEYSFVVDEDRTLTAKFSLQNGYSLITTYVSPTEGGTVTGDGVHLMYANVALTATANEGYHFYNWTNFQGDEITKSATFSFAAMAKEYFMTANFVPADTQYTITASAIPAEGGSIMDADDQAFTSAAFTIGSNVALRAEPAEGYRFSHWTIKPSGVDEQTATDLTCTINSVKQDYVLIANYEKITYTIAAAPNDVTYGSVGGEGIFNPGDSVTLNATPDAGYQFVEWQENGVKIDGVGDEYTFIVTGDRTLTAVFEAKEYTLNVQTMPEESGMSIGDSYVTFGSEAAAFISGTVKYGDTVTLTAVSSPAEGYTFHGWLLPGESLPAPVTDNPFVFTMPDQDDYTVRAVFNTMYFNIKATVEPEAASDFAIIGGAGSGAYGAQRRLDIWYDEECDYIFEGWYDKTGTQLLSTDMEYNFTINGEVDVIARMIPKDGNVRVNAAANIAEGGIVTGAGVYQPGSTATLTATANAGYTFVGWQLNNPGGPVSTSAIYTLTVPEHNVHYTAVFARENETHTLTITAENGTVEDGNGNEYAAVTTFNADDVCRLEPVPASDEYVFDHWEIGRNNPAYNYDDELELFMTSDWTVNAVFRQKTFRFEYEAGANGTVTSPYASFSELPAGTRFTMTAEPDEGYTCTWMVDYPGSGMEPSHYEDLLQLDIEMTGNIVVIVEFISTDDGEGGNDDDTFSFELQVGENGSVSGQPDTDRVATGTTFVLTATPDEGFAVYEWVIFYGDQTFEEATHLTDTDSVEITMTDDILVTVEFRELEGDGEDDLPPAYHLELIIEGEGSVTSTSESGDVLKGTSVTMTATADAGNQFLCWFIHNTDTNEMEEITTPVATFVMNGNTIATAKFIPDDSELRSFACEVNGSGSIISDPAEGEWPVGTEISLTAEPAEGVTFVMWVFEYPDIGSSEEFTDASILFNLAENTVARAVFSDSEDEGIGGEDRFRLTIATDGNGTITSNYPSDSLLPAGTEIIASPVPNEDYKFAYWIIERPDFAEPVESTAEELRFELVCDTAVFAYFEEDLPYESSEYTLQLATEGSGTLTGDPAGTYPAGTAITLTAVPAENWRLCEWRIDDLDTGVGMPFSTNELEFSFVMTYNARITVVFEPGFLIEAKPNDELYGQVNGSGIYYQDEEVTLTATPDDETCTFECWYIVHEDGTLTDFSTEPTITFTPEADMTLLAWFVKEESGQLVIDVITPPEGGGSITGEGAYKEGDEVTLTAKLDEGYVFIGWYENGELVSKEPIYTFIADSDKNLEARFEKEAATVYDVSIVVEPAEGGVATGAGAYEEGMPATVTATANEGYAFIGWYSNGELVSTVAEHTFPVTAATELTAMFEAIQTVTHPVSLLVEPAEGGVVTGAGAYEEGKPATVTATANEGYAFKQWTQNGTAVSTSASYTFTVNGPVTLTAEFTDECTPLLIITHPADMNCIEGEIAVFTVSAQGDGLTYQWQFRSCEGAAWQKVRDLAASGRSTEAAAWISVRRSAVPASYQLRTTMDHNGWQFRCVVTDQYGRSLTSDAATLTVFEKAEIPPTGDDFKAALWLVLLAIGSAGMIFLRRRARI